MVIVCAAPALSVAAPSIRFEVTNPSGSKNNGFVHLGSSITLSTSVADAPGNPSRVWNLDGAGSLALHGAGNGWAVYTPPATLPGHRSVTITASLSTDANAVASYTFELLNPEPVLGRPTPNAASAGATVPITFSGSGFVSGTTILVDGTAVPTTYQSATSIIAQISAPAGPGLVYSVQAHNPAPGASTSEAVSLPVASLQLVATDADGTNTGTARIGSNVTLSTVLAHWSNDPRDWTMTGPGSLSLRGDGNGAAVYTPPATLPTNNQVTVNVSMSSNPSIAASYSFIVGNPLPVVTSVTPGQLLSGGTQTIAFKGNNFLPNSSVQYLGAAYPITYIDRYHGTVQIPVPATAEGAQTLYFQNPAPVGGAVAFTETVPATTIQVAGYDQNGNSTAEAQLEFKVDLQATVTGSMQTAVNWSVAGAGSISNTGVYTPPANLPANRTVVVTATLVSNPAITEQYTLTIVNPTPTITGSNPLSIPAGATTAVTLTGAGFQPQSSVMVNGQAVATTYKSNTELVASIPVGAAVTGNLSVVAENPAPGGGNGPEYVEAVSAPVSLTAAARLLDQTTFGPTTALIQHVQQEGLTAWLSEQYNTPQTVLPIIPADYLKYCPTQEFCTESEWWKTVLTGNDQLRQRVAFALSEMFVVSSDNVSGQGIDNYANMLAGDAFSNWYTIMTDVTLSPAMGVYLNMANSSAPGPGQIANENFARENMQLFNVGLDLINQDGSLQMKGGVPIPAYTELQVEAFARVFTGWTFSNASGTPPANLNNPVYYLSPMVAVEAYHDEAAKALLNGVTLNPGQTAEVDLAEALTNIFNHPNVPPFVCKQLIQHLVKSDPSPEYISRVAAVFINDGNNVRGDMKAVLTAIFTDPEARAGDTDAQASDGHMREPLLWATSVMRGLGYVNVDSADNYQPLSNDFGVLGEWPYRSPSVFNFFPIEFTVPDPNNTGGTLPAPEFALENTASVTDRLTLADTLVSNELRLFNVDLSATSPLGKIAVSGGPAALVQALNNLFLYGTMDADTAGAITSEVSSVKGPAQQVRLAAYLVVTSSAYKILH